MAVVNKVEELIKANRAKDLKIGSLEDRVRHLEEQLRLALYRAFGKSSEKLPGQDDLPFEDLKDDETPATIETTVVAEHERRSKAGRKPLADSLPRVDVHHDLTDAQKTCACGHQLTRIGEDISEKLVMIPAQVWVDRHHHAKFACKHCQGLSDESKPAVIRAQGEPDLIARSIVSASLLAHIWTAKFCDHLPFYRQEVGFARIGAEISRQNMVNWTMTVSGELEPLMDLIETQIREGPLINMDETPVKVLRMPHTGKEGQGYMWLARGGTKNRKAVRYRFAPGRGSQHAKAILGNFRGYLQTDAFSAYDVVAQDSQIIQVGCWAHARRKFMDAEKAAPSNHTKDALGRIRKLYELEKTCREHAKKQGLTDEEFHEYRRSVLVPFLEALKDWMDATAAATLPSGATGKAFAYTAGQWDKLERYLEHPWMTPDNNLAENAIRPFVLGRKNWLFHGNEEGAEASCRVYTLIETAKMNGLEPWAYLKDLLEKLPAVRISGDWESLLPWNINQGKN
jgi:transposase